LPARARIGLGWSPSAHWSAAVSAAGSRARPHSPPTRPQRAPTWWPTGGRPCRHGRLGPPASCRCPTGCSAWCVQVAPASGTWAANLVAVALHGLRPHVLASVGPALGWLWRCFHASTVHARYLDAARRGAPADAMIRRRRRAGEEGHPLAATLNLLGVAGPDRCPRRRRHSAGGSRLFGRPARALPGTATPARGTWLDSSGFTSVSAIYLIGSASRKDPDGGRTDARGLGLSIVPPPSPPVATFPAGNRFARNGGRFVYGAHARPPTKSAHVREPLTRAIPWTSCCCSWPSRFADARPCSLRQTLYATGEVLELARVVAGHGGAVPWSCPGARAR